MIFSRKKKKGIFKDKDCNKMAKMSHPYPVLGLSSKLLFHSSLPPAPPLLALAPPKLALLALLFMLLVDFSTSNSFSQLLEEGPERSRPQSSLLLKYEIR